MVVFTGAADGIVDGERSTDGALLVGLVLLVRTMVVFTGAADGIADGERSTDGALLVGLVVRSVHSDFKKSHFELQHWACDVHTFSVFEHFVIIGYFVGEDDGDID